MNISRSGEHHVAEWHDTTEEYLEAILEIEEEGTIPIRARLVERLGLSAPAVSETVNRLVDHGYAELLDDRSLRLTDKGREVATSIVRRHRLAERLLVDIIGLEWEKVHKEADRWEHAISADHRVIDGHDATAFFEHVLTQLREPAAIAPR